MQSQSPQNDPKPSLPWTVKPIKDREVIYRKHKQAKVVERLQAKYSLSATNKDRV